MDLIKSGKLIKKLRLSQNMTQKQVADILGIEAKTVSKWENGRGFPDVSLISELADIFDINEKTLLSGNYIQNTDDIGNMKKTRFYICKHCGSINIGTGNCEVTCCGKMQKSEVAKHTDYDHEIKISDSDGNLMIEFNHEMTKEHYISFVSYVSYDRVMTIKLYPEQDSAVIFPKMFGGKFYFYCSNHGLFEYKYDNGKTQSKNNTANLTALISAFARAYHFETADCPVFSDDAAKKLFEKEEYTQIKKYISASGKNIDDYINTQLAPTPVARARFCEDRLNISKMSGTSQYVILGSGYDTFGIRNNDDKLNIFELDMDYLINDKLKRLKRARLNHASNVHCISSDIANDDIGKLLFKNGFKKEKKTFFSCLGLMYYLTNAEISNLIEKISAISAEGSTLVFDFADKHLFSSDIVRVKEMLKMANESGNPMKSCFCLGELEAMLQKHGFLIYEFLNTSDIQHEFFDLQNNMTAFEHINFVLAVKKL